MTTQPHSRQHQILELLLGHRAGLSIDNMAAQLEISRNAVKQHLVELEKKQWVQAAELNSTGGRPARSYTLTELGINQFPKQYAWFCNLLLTQLCEDFDSETLERMLWKLGEKLGKSLAPQFSTKPPQERLSAIVELMQSLGYQAAIETQGETTSIKALNCVYHDLAQQHPQLCQFDNALLTSLMGQAVEQTACMAKADCDCQFKVK